MMAYGMTKPKEADFLDVCIQIESEKVHLFHNLMKLFPEPLQARMLWWSLCEEGYGHIAALTFIKGEVELEPEVSKLETLDLEEDQLYHFLRLVERYLRRVRGGQITLDEAFKMVVRLKTSGIDRLCNQILNAVDPMISAMAARSLRPVPFGWIDLVKTIQSCSTDENLQWKVRQLMRKG
jgi:hypothetical protein